MKQFRHLVVGAALGAVALGLVAGAGGVAQADPNWGADQPPAVVVVVDPPAGAGSGDGAVTPNDTQWG
ncbi:hypothetical protein [Streptomyces sp. BH105]|uniref:hypothetical protein n=1 Tax=Streptomyces sp. BH105 TaxID=3410408 RepID=UPI003CEFF451